MGDLYRYISYTAFTWYNIFTIIYMFLWKMVGPIIMYLWTDSTVESDESDFFLHKKT